MGIDLRFANGKRLAPRTYRISEASTPLAGGDSSGETGTMTFEVPHIPDGFLLSESGVTFSDSARGSTIGRISAITANRQTGFDTYDAASRLNEFNIETTVQPFRGTLDQAFSYYCSIANINTDLRVDDAIKTRQVRFPGWSGNLWVGMKEMASGQSADLNLISNNIILRPIRTRIAISDRETDSIARLDSSSLAQKQEVIWYETTSVDNALVYPPGGWSIDVKEVSARAGMTTEQVIELDTSVTSIQQPVMVTSVDKNYASSSVYTIIGDDNLPIQPSQWAAYGGSVSVSINPDTTSLTVKIVAPEGIRQGNNDLIRNYRLALSADSTTSVYSTLRIVGTGVSLNERSIIIPTGVEAYRTAQEFAPTIQSRFLNSLDSAISAGTRGARRHAGRTFTLTATVTGINRRGEQGGAKYPPYSLVQSKYSGMTYAAVKTSLAGQTYGQMRAALFDGVKDSFENQLFGNAPGARFYDRQSARWYRVRQATTAWEATQISADDDLTHGDIAKTLSGMTYGQVRVRAQAKGLTYLKANLIGMGLAA